MLQEKDSRERKIDPVLLPPYNITASDESCFEITVHKFYEKMFRLPQNIYHVIKKNYSSGKYNQTDFKPKRVSKLNRVISFFEEIALWHSSRVNFHMGYCVQL